MRSFINNRIVKRYSVEIAGPRLIDFNTATFKSLAPHLTVLIAEPKGETKQSGQCLELPAKKALNRPSSDTAVDNLAEREAAILAAAQSKAADIIREAEKKAQNLLQESQQSIDSLRQEIREAVWAEVFPQAREEGYQAGLQAAAAEAQQMRAECTRLLELAQRAVETEYEKVEDALLHLAVKIAERILRSSLDLEPGLLLQIVRALVLLPQEREGWKIYLSPEDAAMFTASGFGIEPAIPWTIDGTLGRGDCYLECREGIFDARLQSQLDKLEQALKEEIRRIKGQTNDNVAAIDAKSGTY